MSLTWKFPTALAALGCLGILVSLAAAQTTYTFTTFTVPNSTYTDTTAIAENGDVTGYYGLADGSYQGFLRTASGQITTITYPGSDYTAAYGMNKSGVLAGAYGTFAGFFYSAGSYTNVVVEGQPAPLSDINDSGYYVGIYGKPGVFTAFMASPSGRITTLKYPGGYYTVPVWIKNSGEVIGTYEDQYQRLHTFLYSSKSGYRTIRIPGKPEATIGDINSSGVIVGSYFDGVTDRAFVYQDGAFRNLQVPGANDSTAGAINNKGQIVGAYTTPGSPYIGYIANPVQ
jgi:uncharacterized membrane protein